MLLTIDSAKKDPIYRQIRNQIVEGIATGQLESSQPLPSVRALASDLGINMHTVNKAYALLQDEGYVTIRGRSGAVIAKPTLSDSASQEAARAKMEEELFRLALAFRARGGERNQFLEAAAKQAARAYETPSECNRTESAESDCRSKEKNASRRISAKPASA